MLLKDDKKYPYLCITWSESYPRIFITRRRRFRSPLDRFYGPYVDVGLLRRTLFLVKRVFPLRQRPRALHQDRTCLNYSIGRCPGVCQEKISSDDYHRTLRKVAMVFQGRSDELQNLLQEQMQKYADRTDYESAARVRDQLQGLDQLTADQKMSLPDSSVSRDVLALACDERLAAVQLFQMRAGKLVGRLGYTADASGLSPGVILQRVIEEHYSQVDAVEVPPQLLVQHPLPQQLLLEEWLTEQRERKVQIHCPQRRQKADLIELVQRNAELSCFAPNKVRSNKHCPQRTWPNFLNFHFHLGELRVTTSAISKAVMRWPHKWCLSMACRQNSTTANTKFRAAASELVTAMTSWRWQKSCGGVFAAGLERKPMGWI